MGNRSQITNGLAKVKLLSKNINDNINNQTTCSNYPSQSWLKGLDTTKCLINYNKWKVDIFMTSVR